MNSPQKWLQSPHEHDPLARLSHRLWIPPSNLLVPLCFLFAPLLLVGLFFLSPPTAQAMPMSQSVDCNVELPVIEWLGEGGTTYELDTFDTFVVKRRPFTFALDAGQINAKGETIYRARNNERVWRCRGNCQFTPMVETAFSFGHVDAGTTLQLVVIDDDGVQQDNDQRMNWWAVDDPTTPYTVVTNQSMVEAIDFAVPTSGTWYYYATDSVGIAASCEWLAPTPTGNPTQPTVPPTIPPTVPPTGTVPTLTPVPPTAVSTVPPTPVVTATNTPVPPTVTATNTATHTVTAMSTGTSTPTLTATDVPTETASPTSTLISTATPTAVASDAVIYFSTSSGGVVDGITYADEDILAFDRATDSFVLIFDGSDVGESFDINALFIESDGTILMSFFSPTSLPDLGTVDRSDIVRFTPSTLGDVTEGTFSWVLDGSDVGLDAVSENIDAIARTADGNLVVSTYGNFSVEGLSGSDHDLFLFTATALGTETTGSWTLYFDGSDVGFNTAQEDLAGLWIDIDTGVLYLNTADNFDLTGTNQLTGDENDIFSCTPITLGTETACTFATIWDGALNGLDAPLDGLSLGSVLLSAIGEVNPTEERAEELDLPNKIFLPFVRATD